MFVLCLWLALDSHVVVDGKIGKIMEFIYGHERLIAMLYFFNSLLTIYALNNEHNALGYSYACALQKI